MPSAGSRHELVEVDLEEGERAPFPPESAGALLLRLRAEVVAGELLVVHLHSLILSSREIRFEEFRNVNSNMIKK